MNWLIDRFNALLKWFFDFWLWLPRKLFSMWCDAVISLLNTFVPPEAVATLASYLAAIPAGVWWFLHQIQFATGLQIIIGAIGFRVILKFVPFAGK